MINIDDTILDKYDEKEIYLLLKIASRMRNNRTAWPSLKTLIEDTKWSKNTILKVRNSLEEKGALTVDNRKRDNGSYTSNEYSVIADGIGIYIPLKDSVKGSSKNEQGVVQKMNKQVVQKMNKKEQVNNKEISKAQKFAPPTTDEVATCFKEKMDSIGIKGSDHWAEWEAEKFIDYYESINWIRGKKKMKVWKNAVAQWFKKGREQGTYLKPCPTSSDYENGNRFSANTDEALNDKLLPEPLNTEYQRYITYIIDTFPALWKSKCQVLSKAQWYELTQTEVFPGLRIAMTNRKAKDIRTKMHHLFNDNNFERAKYGSLYDAIIAEYRRHINHEKTLIA